MAEGNAVGEAEGTGVGVVDGTVVGVAEGENVGEGKGVVVTTAWVDVGIGWVLVGLSTTASVTISSWFSV